MQKEFVKLSNNYMIPQICYGTDIVSDIFFRNNLFMQKIQRCSLFFKDWIKILLGKDTGRHKRERGIIKCTNYAVENGCFFFDTSAAYAASETMLCQAFKKYKREEYFICTKLSNYDQLHGKPARECLMESMSKLGIDYVDIYLLHWPVKGEYLKYWKQIEKLYKEGLVRAIGVSNCKIHHLEEIKKIAEIMPMIDEVELHPLLSEEELREYCKQNNIQVMAYTSTARLDFRLRSSGRMKKVCDKYNKTLSQIILRWHIQNGIIPIFNTANINHFITNLDVFDFELADEDMEIIDSMNINSRTRYDSDNCEWERL